MTSEQERRRALRDAYKAERRSEDWDVLGLDRDGLDELLDDLDERLEESGCDHTLRHSRAWAEAGAREWSALEAGLRALGGHCDCEVLANVDPDERN
ncbi:DUF2695 domain-containing protein [Kitasatospora albolonga]|uniref:DUF2695 domain-containing protein n=1 Tax=Kitasatospora albolonga TaxID=68173 RepID=UPI0031E82D3F